MAGYIDLNGLLVERGKNNIYGLQQLVKNWSISHYEIPQEECPNSITKFNKLKTEPVNALHGERYAVS